MPTSNPFSSQTLIFDETNVQVGAIGLVIELTILEDSTALDISTATVKKIIFSRSGATKRERDAIFSTNGTDGKIRYTTVLNDIDDAGIWHVQGYIEMGGFKGYSSLSSFQVKDNI